MQDTRWDHGLMVTGEGEGLVGHAGAWRSPAEGRWLAAGTQRDQDVESGSVIAVTEGAQIVAYFTVQHIACL